MNKCCWKISEKSLNLAQENFKKQLDRIFDGEIGKRFAKKVCPGILQKMYLVLVAKLLKSLLTKNLVKNIWKKIWLKIR